jgi:hypothetical protein
MEKVYIRIPLKRVIAGAYKVGLTPRDEESSIYVNGGWIDTEGTIHPLLPRLVDPHTNLAQELGYTNTRTALDAGCIRVAVYSRDYFVEFKELTPRIRSHIIDFLQGANSSKEVLIESYNPPFHRKFKTIEEALDSLENRRVFAAKSAASLPDLVQQTNAFSVKNRPGCTPILRKSDPKDLFLDYNVKCNLPESDPSGHEVRVHFDVSKVEETGDAKNLDVRVSCSCPAFLYWGAQWNLHQRDGLEGEPRPKLQAPTKRLDLRSNFVICKHCKSVFERILPSVQHNVDNIIRKLEVKRVEEKWEEEGKPTPTIRRQLLPKDEQIQQKLQEGLEKRERERILKEQGIVKRTEPGEEEEMAVEEPEKPEKKPDIVTVPSTPEEEDKEFLKWQEKEERGKLIREKHKKLLEEKNAPKKKPGQIEEHPAGPHLHKGLPYKRTLVQKPPKKKSSFLRTSNA